MPREQIPARVADLAASLKAAEKRIAEFERQALAGRVPAIAANAKPVGAVTAVLEQVGDARQRRRPPRRSSTGVRDGSARSLRWWRSPRRSVAGRWSSSATNREARDAGAKAGQLARAAAQVLGGGGGGRDDLAQGGGSDASAIGPALDAVAAGLPR